jgi:taurine dioxygenase
LKNGPRVRREPTAATTYATITVEKLTPLIGAELGGVDLSRPLSAEQQGEIGCALLENLVIFLRDQQITPEQHLTFGRLFGELHVHPAAPHEPGHPELMIIRTEASSQRANGEGWHSDVSCEQEPPMGSILYLKQCPPSGGDTLFANTYAAYDALSDRMKAYVEGLTAIHDGEHVYRGLYANAGVADKPTYPRAEHPVVRTHPVTKRRSLYVNRGFTTRLVGLARDESDAVLAYLFDHVENELFQCRFRWRQNSIAFWDNRCAQHRAMWDYWPHTRAGHRVTIKGDRPV